MKIHDTAIGPYRARVRIALAEKETAVTRPLREREPCAKASIKNAIFSPRITRALCRCLELEDGTSIAECTAIIDTLIHWTAAQLSPADQDFVATDFFSMAEITAIGRLIFSDLLKLPIPDECKTLRSWYSGMQDRPSVQNRLSMASSIKRSAEILC